MSNEAHIPGVLVSFTLGGAWSGRSDDERLAVDVQERHSLTAGSTKVRKQLFPTGTCGDKNPHSEWIAAVWQVRKVHYDLTLPWQKPLRILAGHAQPGYDVHVNAAAAKAMTAFGRFLAWYEEGIQLARAGLNGAFDIDDYPDASVLRAKFKFALEYLPVPEANHYSPVLAGPAIARARMELEQVNAQRLREAIKDVWGRVLGPLQHMATVLAEPKPLFRDSLVTNVEEIANLVPALNITGDTELHVAGEQLKALLRQINGPDALRDQPVLRAQVAAEAAALARNFGKHTRKLSK